MATVQNIVCTAKLSNEINLLKIFETTSSINIFYDPKHFNAMIIKIKYPKATGLLFHTGKIVCIGAKSIADTMNFLSLISNLLIKSGYHSTICDLKICNVVGSGSLNSNLDLISLAKTYKKYVEYEPELFPGARLCFPGIKGTAILFHTGKIIVTGLKSESDMRKFYNRVVLLIEIFKRPFHT